MVPVLATAQLRSFIDKGDLIQLRFTMMTAEKEGAEAVAIQVCSGYTISTTYEGLVCARAPARAPARARARALYTVDYDGLWWPVRHIVLQLTTNPRVIHHHQCMYYSNLICYYATILKLLYYYLRVPCLVVYYW